jgi:hypothetical protein
MGNAKTEREKRRRARRHLERLKLIGERTDAQMARRPDMSRRCSVCRTPFALVPGTDTCAPCTFGEAASLEDFL